MRMLSRTPLLAWALVLALAAAATRVGAAEGAAAAAAAARAPVSTAPLDPQYIVGLVSDEKLSELAAEVAEARNEGGERAALAESPIAKLLKDDPDPAVEVVHMTARNGQRYECRVPPRPQPQTQADEGEAAAAAATAPAGGKDEDGGAVSPFEDARVATAAGKGAAAPQPPKPQPQPQPQPQETMRAKVLPLQGADCAVFNTGYWLYRVCPFRKITQYHEEAGQISMTFELGDYDPSGDESHASLHYLQRYRGGTGGRVTAVTYVCDESEQAQGSGGSKGAKRKPSFRVLSLREPKALSYEMQIATPLACAPPGPAPGSLAAQLALRQAPISDILLPLSKGCQSLNMGWWTYEFCHLRHVRQYHVDTVTRKVGDEQRTEAVLGQEFFLGRFSNQPLLLQKRARPEDTYVSQLYTDGTECDLTHRPRQVDVHFVCREGSQQAVLGVKETSTCHYEMQVLVPNLCFHKDFAPVRAPVQTIVCKPVRASTAQPH